MPHHLLVTGARGFIGRHVTAAALSDPDVRLRLVHRTPDASSASSTPGAPGPLGASGGPEVPLSSGTRAERVIADLRDPAAVRGLCAGVDTVVHCASSINADDETLHAVNDLGTRALVEDARRHGVRRVVYVSTAAVYGRGPFRDARAEELTLDPQSATSRSRAAAERHVLDAGGTVLRPHLVHGAGDRWVVPGLARLLRHLGAGIATTALHSAVDVTTLGRAVLAAALTDQDIAGAHHANHPVPLAADELIGLLLARLGLPAEPRLTPEETLARVGGNPQAVHNLTMLTVDHHFASDGLWKLLGIDPGPSPSARLPHELDEDYRLGSRSTAGQ
ncbi:NAD-dependent epimerase/dehydratase family protein [Streptomyces sp. NPDC059785]|uniref:NAD-dependent epimerase/dehydratase family protein n=1 Tax=Streptomyces sp. NPDC059785 TaxID=3346945 RepID=UPI0036512815